MSKTKAFAILVVSLVLSAGLAHAVSTGGPGFKSTNGGPNEHASQDMTAKSITLSAASGANAVGVTTNGARIDFGAGASDYMSSNGSTITAATTFSASSLSSSAGVSAVTMSFLSTAVTTCGSGAEGDIRREVGGGGTFTKICVCRFDGTTYRWYNMLNPSAATGNTTTCPA